MNARSLLALPLSALLLVLAACGGSADAPPPLGAAPVVPVVPVPPTITEQPTDATVTVGQTASFTVAATGDATITYQWQKNGTAVAGATSTTYTTPATVLGDSGATFRAVATNGAGSATSNSATLTVTTSAPVLTITPQPASTSVAAGAAATFTVGGTCSSGTLDIQWQRFVGSVFTNIAGATAASFTITSAASTDNGAQFRAVLDCSGQSSTPSSVATLTVTSTSSVTLTAVPLVGLRAQAEIPLIAGVALDPAGSFSFITNNRIKRLSADLTTINPVAGGTDPGSADGPAATASFNQPSELTVDATGILYVADTGNHTIRRIAVDGTVSTLAGSAGVSGSTDGTGSAARFAGPTGIAMGPDGDLYVADLQNQRIRRVTTAGVVTTYAGSSLGYADSLTPLGAQFFGPYSVAVAANGDVLVADAGNSRIRRILRNGAIAGAVQTVAGGSVLPNYPDGVGAAAGFSGPRGLALRGNTLTVRDFGLLRQVDLTTAVVTTFTGTRTPTSGSIIPVSYVDGPPGTAQFRNSHYGLSLAPNGGFMVAEDLALRAVSSTGLVQTIAASAALGVTSQGLGTLSQMPFGLADNMPQAAVLDPSGNIVIADGQAQLVRRVSPAGTVTLAAGLTGSDNAGPFAEVDGIGSAAQFRFVGASIASDTSGVLYVGDFSGVRRIAPDNTTTTIAGSRSEHGAVDGNATTARFGQVWGVALGANGDLFASDYDNGAIRRIDASGNVTTYAGVMGSRSRVDGPIAAARFHYPGQMAFAQDGALYVVDGDTDTAATTTGVIRRIAPDGLSVSTVAGITLGGFGNSAFNTVRLPFAFAVAPDGSIYYGGTGLMVLPAGSSTPSVVIPYGTLTLGSSPSVANIMGLTFASSHRLILLSDGQILQVNLP